jgi:hypothetical protein
MNEMVMDPYETAAQIEREMEGPARNVVEALIRVVRDLPAVAKDEKMAGESGGYKYRGIEAMTAAAQPLFGKHGVLVCPRVLETMTEPITKGGKPWVHRTMKVEYVLRGSAASEDYVVVGPFVAEADDNSDKSANKCLTQAFKQMLLQVLVISDRKDDPDDANVDRDAPAELQPVGETFAEVAYNNAVKQGYTRADLDGVVQEHSPRMRLAHVLHGDEYQRVRDAWAAFKAANPIAAPAQPSSSGQGEPASGDSVAPTSTENDMGSQDSPAGAAKLESAVLGSKAREARRHQEEDTC